MSEKNFFDHAYFLRLALAQAKRRQGFCAPNPSVGAIAVIDGEVVGQAYHERAGMAHAEAALLSQIPSGLEHLSLYVTLEPCHHWGKTPPCVEAIIDYKVETVVFAYQDPLIHLPGQNSIALLEAKGIKVIHFPLAEIDNFYQSYRHWVLYGQPRVRAKWAQSFDGKVAYPGERVQLSNPSAQVFTHEQRLRADIILTTSTTVMVDQPKFNVRLPPIEVEKPLAVIDRHLRLSGQEIIFQTANPIHIFHLEDSLPNWRHPRVQFHAMHNLDDLQFLLKKIGELGYHELWLEAGPRFLASMHQQGLVDETFILICPKILGDEGVNAFLERDFFSHYSSISAQCLADNILVHLKWERDGCLLV